MTTYTITYSHDEMRNRVSWTDRLLCNIDDDHVMNILLWLCRRQRDIKEFKLPELPLYGHPIEWWIDIMRNEVNYRIERNKSC
jgi:hypothetical protein